MGVGQHTLLREDRGADPETGRVEVRGAAAEVTDYGV